MPVMQGLDFKSLRRHPSLYPLFFCLFVGGAAVVVSTTRCALKNPDVSWNKKKNPEPWQHYANNRRYLLLDPAGTRGWETQQRINSIWE